MNVRDTIVLLYDYIPEQTTLAGELCPACKGGGSGERTLSVSRKDGILLWNCHRASCNLKGAAGGGSKTRARTPSEVHCRGVVGRTIARESSVVEETTRQWLMARYALTAHQFSRAEISWDEDTNRLCLPVFGWQGERRGVVLRALDGRKPKTLTHTEQGAMAWYTNTHTSAVIIVEDQLSAIRASDYLNSVALLGTHLNEERVAEIKASGCKPVYLALDADAYALAVKYTIEYRSELRPQLLRLAKDIKDHTDEELTALLGQYC